MTFWEAILLGIVQGLTEFLPISSSGHLVLAEAILGIQDKEIVFEVVVHFGTLLAVVTLFRSDLLKILGDFKLYGMSKLKRVKLDSSPKSLEGLNLLRLLVIGTIPAALIGFFFQENFESAFADPKLVSIALLFTGLILLISRFTHEQTPQISKTKAFLIGLAQVLALFPGISRSGTTITAGLLLGIQPLEAARYSFLLAVPVILGANLIQVAELLSNPVSNDQIVKLLLGCAAAYGAGFLAIKWLMAILQKGRFDRFAYYCFAVGILGIILTST